MWEIWSHMRIHSVTRRGKNELGAGGRGTNDERFRIFSFLWSIFITLFIYLSSTKSSGIFYETCIPSPWKPVSVPSFSDLINSSEVLGYLPSSWTHLWPVGNFFFWRGWGVWGGGEILPDAGKWEPLKFRKRWTGEKCKYELGGRRKTVARVRSWVRFPGEGVDPLGLFPFCRFYNVPFWL